ncbi:BgTH12-05019 [Blumeria graminis f. sp. triticale]|uniref:BgTH12-05018 n=1 Tax=Blumeria graminis f. sp. triticale TaxID=1689686 RepID=A0A9W4D1J1_BLUGR|nr:BgTH12-05018 [Blumeria graminis f. sp. triticale]CAD6502427.1 BgTH12-05019 [Blumeria graminis f. sp. triticale]
MAPPARGRKRELSDGIATRSNLKLNAAISGFAVSRGLPALVPQNAPPNTHQVLSPGDKDTIEEDQLIDNTFPESTIPTQQIDGDKEETSVTPMDTENSEPAWSYRTSLMSKARGLLNLVGPYLEDMEKECPGAGADFLALISEGVSRAIRGQKIYKSSMNEQEQKPSTQSDNKRTWASKAPAGVLTGTNIDVRRPMTRPTPPKNQSKEDKRVPFGVAVLDASPAKAASILQQSEAIAARFGNATVERQETRTTFVIGPIPKKVNTLDGAYDPFEGLLLEEPAIRAIKDDTPIRHIAWTRRSTDSLSPFGHIRIHVPQARAHKMPSRMQLFGQATSVQRVSNKQLLRTCNKCFGFHAMRTCARQFKCASCGMDSHEGPCSRQIQCLNCRGPHKSNDTSCPARPQRDHGVFVPPTGAQLRHIRAAGRRELANTLRHTQESAESGAETLTKLNPTH